MATTPTAPSALPTTYQTLGTNQYIAILHTQINSSTASGKFQLTFDQNSNYCAYFANHPSSWNLWLSAALREQMEASHLSVSIDDKSAQINAAELKREFMTIDIPPGLAVHSWKLELATSTRER